MIFQCGTRWRRFETLKNHQICQKKIDKKWRKTVFNLPIKTHFSGDFEYFQIPIRLRVYLICHYVVSHTYKHYLPIYFFISYLVITSYFVSRNREISVYFFSVNIPTSVCSWTKLLLYMRHNRLTMKIYIFFSFQMTQTVVVEVTWLLEIPSQLLHLWDKPQALLFMSNRA